MQASAHDLQLACLHLHHHRFTAVVPPSQWSESSIRLCRGRRGRCRQLTPLTLNATTTEVLNTTITETSQATETAQA